MSTNDGGPAFPSSPTIDPNGGIMRPADMGCPGISIRDYFAAKALTGMLAYSHVNPSSGNYHENCTPAGVAMDAYALADAMLAERAKATA